MQSHAASNEQYEFSRTPLRGFVDLVVALNSVVSSSHPSSSYPSNVISGVPQGTVLAPLLFLCLVSDIPLNITSKIRLYANDILLYRRITFHKDCTLLQNEINSLIK